MWSLLKTMDRKPLVCAGTIMMPFTKENNHFLCVCGVEDCLPELVSDISSPRCNKNAVSGFPWIHVNTEMDTSRLLLHKREEMFASRVIICCCFLRNQRLLSKMYHPPAGAIDRHIIVLRTSQYLDMVLYFQSTIYPGNALFKAFISHSLYRVTFYHWMCYNVFILYF